jgi:hypothetical protein
MRRTRDISAYSVDRRVICLAFAAACLSATRAFCATFIDSAPTLDAVKGKLPEFQTWLREAGLDDTIEVVRPHRGPHPRDDQLTLIHLETRWARPIQSRDRALAEFADLAKEFLLQSGHSLQHKLLFKFCQICGVPPTLAAAHVNVVDINVAAYITADGQPATDVSGLRMARANVTIPTEPPSSALKGKRIPDSDGVMGLLEKRFALRKARFIRAPVFPGIVPFRVDNLRGEIVADSKLWENLEGTLFMNLDGDKVLLFLDIGGQYAAAGFGDLPPSPEAFRDLEPRYAKQLANYGNQLLQELQEALGEMVR